jgi:hypothetical protein
MNTRQLATILAALRYWQRQGLQLDVPELDIATNAGAVDPLSTAEIDELTQQINFGEFLLPGIDIENVTKATQSAAFLCGDLSAVVSSKNPQLAAIAYLELEIAAKLRRRLEQLQENLANLSGQS